MTDRELLEMAAKAAGVDAAWRPNVAEGGEWLAVEETIEGRTTWTEWNPLDEDGDALRLAVKLGLGTDHSAKRSWAWRSWNTHTVLAQEEFHSDHAGDQCAATRRAIVRAAAEIGRSM